MDGNFFLFLSLWFGISLAVAYLLSAHFLSSITVHFLHFLRRLGWYRGKKEYWDNFPEFEGFTITTQDGETHSLEWQDWFIMAFNDTWWQKMLADLITCPICLSFHLSFWLSAAAISIAFFSLSLSPWVFTLIPLFALSIPPFSLTIYNYVRRQHI